MESQNNLSNKKELPFSGALFLVHPTGLEPARLAAPDPKSGVSANSTIGADATTIICVFCGKVNSGTVYVYMDYRSKKW